MTMLSTVQDFCRRTGLPVPTTVFGTTDSRVRQVYSLLEEEGVDLSRRGDWEALTLEATHASLALENQGAITSLAPNAFRKIKNQTIWDRTDRLPIFGPMSPQGWQAMKGMYNTGPRYQFRIRGGNLLVDPVPSAGHSWYFEYVSKAWILDADGVTYKERFTHDTDEPLLDNDLLLQGLRWRWKKEKGLDYAEDFRTYEMQVKDALGNDGGKPTLSMDNCRSARPGIWVSPGSWNL